MYILSDYVFVILFFVLVVCLGVTFCPKEVTRNGYPDASGSCGLVVRARRERDLDIIGRRRGFSFIL
jgi:hypothetical protein